MKILSNNEELLKELEQKFKNRNVLVSTVKVPADIDDKGILEDIVQLIIENPEESRAVIEYVLDELTSLANQEHIFVLKNDGTKIPYAEYKAMSDEEKAQEVF